MMLAQAYLISCGEGVNRLGTEEPGDRIRDIKACYRVLSSMVRVVTTAMRFEMKSTKGAMTPQSESKAEAYSEGGLSGEAAVGVNLDTEPFMLREHTDEEVADYDDGFKAGFKGRPNDDTKSEAWQRGWGEAQE
jgi:hypothetical protein